MCGFALVLPSSRLSPQFVLELHCVCMYDPHPGDGAPGMPTTLFTAHVSEDGSCASQHRFLSIDSGHPVAAGKSQGTI
jgi:hypothetical protein